MGFMSGIGHAISSGVKSIGRVASGAFNTVKDFAGGTLGHMIGGAAQGYANGGFGGMFSGIMSSLGGAKGSSPDMFSGLGSALGSYFQARNSGGHLSGFKLDLGSGSDLYNGVGGTTQFTPQPVKTAAEQGADTRAYLKAAFPEMNPWERAGTGGTMFGSNMETQVLDQGNQARNQNVVLAGQQLQAQGMAKDLAIAKMQQQTALQTAQLQARTQLMINTQNNQTSLQSAGIASQTSRANTQDNIALGYQNLELAKTKLSAELGQIAASTQLTQQQKKNAIAQEIQTFAQIHNIQLSASQISAQTKQIMETTQNVVAQRPGIIQDNENKKYGTLFIGSTIKDLSNQYDWWTSPLEHIKHSFTGSNSAGIGSVITPNKQEQKFRYLYPGNQ